ncbi:4-aminobutyrate aminotransferase [Purpureocillium lilacinum]|uniref:4-aminobutyrate aminotransferase n=1 Tax=Purpureocillium lilacinum TaxID=33203 RepID=A0A179GVR7_PURLI|nr:4-aminobutyrate aminotransferase [Purpureocillium lilacinum]
MASGTVFAKRDVPGPVSKAASNKLSNVFDARAVHFVVNYEKSSGNYIVDVDGNKYLDVHCPIAGLIVEPIQSEGGDNHASPAFFQGLRKLTKKYGIILIVDEVQTGFGATGKFWAHEHWSLKSPPDIVTFSKKAQTAGYYFGDQMLIPDKAYRQFNTWIGDPARVILSKAVIQEILDKKLVEQCARVGEILYTELEKLMSQYPDQIMNLRGKGQGTFIAFDTQDAATLALSMKQLGVNIGTCGVQTVRLRPMLSFDESYVPSLVAAFCMVFGDKSRRNQM